MNNIWTCVLSLSFINTLIYIYIHDIVICRDMIDIDRYRCMINMEHYRDQNNEIIG